MATTVSYSASMRTRKTNSASNAKSSDASQEYYENTYNYVGIVHFAGMALSGKVITGISLRVVAAQAGYGTGHTKTVYVRKANYQSASQSGITGLGYCGDALGTFTGAFYGNTSTYTLSGDLLNNLAAYIAEGNNTICLYNPNPVKSSQGYSTNYLQWSECTITVTYEEAASKPSLSKTSFEMGTAVTIYTNRQSSIATHTIRYSFFSANGTIATGVTASCTWTPPVSLAEQIPNATSGWGTILCDTYVNGNLVSTNTCAFQLTVPASVAPSISNVAFSEATSGIADRFGGYVRTRSKLSVSITAAGTQGSSISAYRTSIDSVTYSGSSFTSNTLNTAGNLTMTVTVTDSRGRTASTTRTVTVLDYSPPSLSLFTAERCNADGTAGTVRQHSEVLLSEKQHRTDCAEHAGVSPHSFRDGLPVLRRKNGASAPSQAEALLLGLLQAALVARPPGHGEKCRRPPLFLLRACVSFFAGTKILQPRLLYQSEIWRERTWAQY